MATTKNVPAKANPSAQSEQTQGMTKAEAVKQALATLGDKASLADIKSFIKKQYGLEISETYYYLVKQEIAKKSSGSPTVAPKAAKPTTPTAPKAEAHAVNGVSAASIGLGDIQTIKDLTERYGAGDLETLIRMLSK